MKKRLALALLVILTLCSGIPGAYAENEMPTFPEFDTGTTITEAQEVLTEKLGISFRASDDTLLTHGMKDFVTFYGQEWSLGMSVLEGETKEDSNWMLTYTTLEDDLPKRAEKFASIASQLIQQFGDYGLATIRAAIDGQPTSFLFNGNATDADTIAALLLSNEDIFLTLSWEYMSVWVSCRNMPDIPERIFLRVHNPSPDNNFLARIETFAQVPPYPLEAAQ